jgi:hypothetical protein
MTRPGTVSKFLETIAAQSGNEMINRFTIQFGAAKRVVAPINETKFKLTEQPEGDNIFFRRKLGSPVVLRGLDYKFLLLIEKSANRCEEVLFLWERKCSDSAPWKVHFSGVFGVGDAKWNLDKCEVQFSPKTNDAYRVLLENYTRDENVLKVLNTVSTVGRLETSETFEFKEIDAGTIDDQDDSDTWSTFLNVTSWVSGTLTSGGVRNHNEIIFRLRTTRPLVSGQPVDLADKGWTLISTDATTAYYAKTPEVYGFKPYTIGSWGDWGLYPDIKLVPAGQAYDATKYISLNANGANSGICGQGLRIRTYLADERCWNILWEFGTFTFTRNRRLLEVIRYLIRQADPKLEPATDAELSTFFTAAINPVTGETNKLRDPLLAQLSDVKRYRSSEAATKGMLSLRDAFTDLRGIANVRWFVNAKGKVQIEHLSYFEAVSTFDLTVPKWKKQLVGTNSYEYLKAKMPRFEKLTFAIGQNDPFLESTIEYFGACIVKDEGEDTATINVNRITTDIEGVMVSGGSFPDAGFVLISQDGSGVIPKQATGVGVRLYLNGHLSATNLFEVYHKNGRVMPSGQLNGKTVFFDSVVRTKKQADITVPLCCETVDPTGIFASGLGTDARAAVLTHNFDGSVTFQLVHDAFAGLGSVTFGAQFDESFDFSFLS